MSREKKPAATKDFPLFEACYSRDVQGAIAAIGNGADVNAVYREKDPEWRFEYDHTPLMTVVDSFYKEDSDLEGLPAVIEIIQLLLDHGADINHISQGSDKEDIWTALRRSAIFKPIALTRFLLGHGADPNVVYPVDGTTLDEIRFDLFVEMGSWKACRERVRELNDIFELLLEFGALSSHAIELEARQDLFGPAARLSYACRHLDFDGMHQAFHEGAVVEPEMMNAVIELGSQFERKNYRGKLPEFERQLIRCIGLLLEHGINVNCGNGNALYSAVYYGYDAVAAFLVSRGAVPQSCNCSYCNTVGRATHYYTLAERVRQWGDRWPEALAAKLIGLVDRATREWEEHPDIEILRYTAAKGERSGKSIAELAELYADAWRKLDVQEVRNFLRSDFQYSSRLNGDTAINSFDYESYLRRAFLAIREAGGTVTVKDVLVSPPTGAITLEQDGNFSALYFECENGMIIKAHMGPLPRPAGECNV